MSLAEQRSLRSTMGCNSPVGFACFPQGPPNRHRNQLHHGVPAGKRDPAPENQADGEARSALWGASEHQRLHRLPGTASTTPHVSQNPCGLKFGGGGWFDLSTWLDFVLADVGWAAWAGEPVSRVSQQRVFRFASNVCVMGGLLEVHVCA